MLTSASDNINFFTYLLAREFLHNLLMEYEHPEPWAAVVSSCRRLLLRVFSQLDLS